MVYPEFYTRRDAELFIGLVAPLGVDRDIVVQALNENLKQFQYRYTEIKLSGLIRSFKGFENLKAKDEMDRYDYYNNYMDKGNELRKKFGSGEALAWAAMNAVLSTRRNYYKDNPEIENKGTTPIPRMAYIFNSLKHVDEVTFLRGVYQKNFVLISIYAHKDERIKNLAKELADSANETKWEPFKTRAMDLINRDEMEEGQPYGQKVRDVFSMSDFFINSEDEKNVRAEISRFLDLLFGNPFVTPSVDEFAMFHAYATALKSSAISRQVGASICTDDGLVLGLGCNEVPKAGGGFYWESDENDKRDFKVAKGGLDPSTKIKHKMFEKFIEYVLGMLEKDEMLSKKLDDKTIEDFLAKHVREYESSELYNSIFVDRTIHAEMSAILDAAMKGLSVKGATLYTTTYPCHYCAKHIVFSGIKKVVFIEPYPKSLTIELHEDSMTFDPADPTKGKVPLRPFVGIAPSLYLDLFARHKKERLKEGKLVTFDRSEATLRIGSGPALYTFNEIIKMTETANKIEKLGLYELNENMK